MTLQPTAHASKDLAPQRRLSSRPSLRAGLCAVAFLSPLLGGCLSSRQLPAIIRELAKDTNTMHLKITSPAFGTLELDRNK